ncbi:MAG: dihydropteroate synthase [Gammaproteobacteria bacterium]
MGILNVTSDSFSDGGRFVTPDAALHQARRMCAEGAAIIDVGGESTRPGARSVSVAEELDRVVPVIEAIRAELPALISVDTSKPEVMRAAVSAGAEMINDVRALRAEGAMDTVRELHVPVCLMHMQGEPKTMQVAPLYQDVVQEVSEFLAQRVNACEAHGIPRDSLVIDPGFGFGKTLDHNLRLLRELGTLVALGLPVAVGLSRKSMIGALLNKSVDGRLYGSLALSVLAALKGAAIFRAHDVGPTVEALKVVAAVTRPDQH